MTEKYKNKKDFELTEKNKFFVFSSIYLPQKL